jgi:hypothetical protein
MKCECYLLEQMQESIGNELKLGKWGREREGCLTKKYREIKKGGIIHSVEVMCVPDPSWSSLRDPKPTRKMINPQRKPHTRIISASNVHKHLHL